MHARWFFFLAVIALGAGFIFLQYNMRLSEDMTELVLEKDENGTLVAEDIQELQEYVATHTNASTSFRLDASLERDYNAAVERAAPRQDEGALYAEAQSACDIVGSSSIEQAKCVQEYLFARLDPADNPAPIDPPNPADYNFNFTSPVWVMDNVGISFTAAGALIILGVGAFFANLGRKKPEQQIVYVNQQPIPTQPDQPPSQSQK